MSARSPAMTPISSAFAIVQPGLEWDYDDVLFGPEPTWTMEPDIDVIRQIVLRELSLSECDIEFLAEGSFNKVYKVVCKPHIDGSEQAYIMRVTLPVHPHFKTRCEVATIEFVRHHTNMPLAAVLKYEVNLNDSNELGFEWIIQDFLPGESLEEAWHKVDWLKKELLVRKVVAYLACLFEKRFDRIGGLYHTPEQPAPERTWVAAKLPHPWHEVLQPTTYSVGETVSQQLFVGDHLAHNVSRGPFKSSRQWLATRIQLYMEDALKVLTDPGLDANDYDRTAATGIMTLGTKLLVLLPTVFPNTEEKETFILHHHDLDIQNMLVDPETGDLTGVIDWECIHTSPLWHACQLPKFLCGPTYHALPLESEHMIREDDGEDWVLDDIYWDRLRYYEQTALRKLFFEEMQRVCPEWVKTFKESGLKADFELAVREIDNELCFGPIMSWVEDVEKGNVPVSLRDRFRK